MIGLYLSDRPDRPAPDQEAALISGIMPQWLDCIPWSRHPVAEWHMRNMWSIMFDIISGFRALDPRIFKLARLVMALQQRSGVWEWRHPAERSWAELPYFDEELDKYWRRSPNMFDSSSQASCTMAEWTAMNSFVALLGVKDVKYIHRYAIFSIRNAVQHAPQSGGFGYYDAVMNFGVPAAAVWIMIAGKTIFDQVLQQEHFQSPQGISIRQWQFWKLGFMLYGRREDGKRPKIKALALAAADKMAEIRASAFQRA